eukprot:Ihof_evm3s112 gene=Ihof_evmTU3s112
MMTRYCLLTHGMVPSKSLTKMACPFNTHIPVPCSHPYYAQGNSRRLGVDTFLCVIKKGYI